MKGFCIVVSSLMLAGAIQVGAQDYSQPTYPPPGAPPDQYYPNPAPPPAPSGQMLAGDQLDQLLGPIALYPDPLIAEILPAAMQPSQIAVAANYVNSGGDPNLIDSQPWDSSVKAIAHDPQLLQMMNGNLEWTAELGQAYANQPTDVMNSIQRLRADAMQQGNLQSGPQETVENYDGQIEIIPTNPETIYVPEYDPYAVYYEPGVPFTWGFGFALGPWFAHDFDWWHHRMVYWGPDHPRPHDWWHERPRERYGEIRRAPEWRAPRPEAPRWGGIGRGFTPFARGGDRGYAPPAPRELPRPGIAPRGELPRPGIAPRGELPSPGVVPRAPFSAPREAPREAPRPSFNQREAPRAVAPARPSLFGHESAPEARAASNRGAESRGVSPSFGGGGNRGGGGGERRH